MFHASYFWNGPQLPKDCGRIGFISSMHKIIPDSFLKGDGGNPGNSGVWLLVEYGLNIEVCFNVFNLILQYMYQCIRTPTWTMQRATMHSDKRKQ